MGVVLVSVATSKHDSVCACRDIAFDLLLLFSFKFQVYKDLGRYETLDQIRAGRYKGHIAVSLADSTFSLYPIETTSKGYLMLMATKWLYMDRYVRKVCLYSHVTGFYDNQCSRMADTWQPW
jgi:hypothetical protein